MNIGVDIRPLQRETRFRGIGKHLEHLLAAMAKLPNEHHFIFFAEKGLPLPKELLETFSSSEIRYLPPYYLSRIRFIRAFAPPSRIIKTDPSEIDVMFVSDATVGMPKGAPVVAVFHDIIPFLFRDKEIIEKTKGIRKLKRQLASSLYWQKYQRFLNSFSQATHIIAISEQSKKDLHKYVPSTSHIPTTVIYHGAPDLLASSSKAKLPKSIKPNDTFLLYVGGIDLRKNIVGMAKAFVAIKKTHPKLKLVVVGKEFGLTDQLHDLGWYNALKGIDYAKDVINTGFVDDATLAVLYAKAKAFIFPSQYEGFGLPILEAMQEGCPVVTYDNSSIPEVAGDATLLVRDHPSFVSALRSALDDPKLRANLIKKGKQQAKKFTWEKSAKQTLAVLEKSGSKAKNET